MESTEQHKDLKPSEALQVIKWTYNFLYKLEPKLTIITTATGIIMGLRGIVSTYIISRIMDMLVNSAQNPDATLRDIVPYLGMLLAYNLVVAVLSYIEFASNREFNTKIEYKAEIALAEQLMKLGIPALEQPDVNNKIFRARSSIGNMENFYRQCVRVLVFFVGFIISLAIILSYIPIMAPIVILTSIPEYLIDKKYRKKVWSLYLDNTEKRRLAGENVRQLSHTPSLPEIYVNGAFGFLMDKYRNVEVWFTEIIIKVYKKWALTARGAGLLSDLGIYTGFILIFKNLIAGLTTVGNMFFQIRMIQTTQTYLKDLTSQINNIMELSVRIQEVYEIFQMEAAEKDGAIQLPRLEKGPEIKIEDVYFSYPSSEKEVLSNINLTIKPGEKIAIVGENGSGKTTLVKLICRMYPLERGHIKINGISLENLKINDWYKNLGVMFQEYNIYSQLTARENIEIGRIKERFRGNSEGNNNSKEAKMKEAAENSNVIDNIEQFPNGWDQLLSEKYKGGIRPSTGQWQKIAISRFFYRDAPVVIFDEPTSSIDAISEYAIFNKIYGFFKEKTVVIISHRFSTVRNADRIIVLKDGRIAEEGNHNTLMNIENGLYKTSFELQKHGYE